MTYLGCYLQGGIEFIDEIFIYTNDITECIDILYIILSIASYPVLLFQIPYFRSFVVSYADDAMTFNDCLMFQNNLVSNDMMMASSSDKSELNSSASFSSNSDEVDDLFITCCAPNGCSVPSPVNLHEVSKF